MRVLISSACIQSFRESFRAKASHASRRMPLERSGQRPDSGPRTSGQLCPRTPASTERRLQARPRRAACDGGDTCRGCAHRESHGRAADASAGAVLRALRDRRPISVHGHREETLETSRGDSSRGAVRMATPKKTRNLQKLRYSPEPGCRYVFPLR